MSEERFRRFSDFYPFYLTEHRKTSTRVLHFIGTLIALCCFAGAIATRNAWYVLIGFAFGYGFAWVGHFFFERNKPATFRYPLWSLAGDFKLFFELLIGRERF